MSAPMFTGLDRSCVRHSRYAATAKASPVKAAVNSFQNFRTVGFVFIEDRMPEIERRNGSEPRPAQPVPL